MVVVGVGAVNEEAGGLARRGFLMGTSHMNGTVYLLLCDLLRNINTLSTDLTKRAWDEVSKCENPKTLSPTITKKITIMFCNVSDFHRNFSM